MTDTTELPTTSLLMRCSRCHSPNVMRDAWAVWNAATAWDCNAGLSSPA